MTLPFTKPILDMEIRDAREFLKSSQRSFKLYATKRATLQAIRRGLGRHAAKHLTLFLSREILCVEAHLSIAEDDISHWTEIIEILERRNPQFGDET